MPQEPFETRIHRLLVSRIIWRHLSAIDRVQWLRWLVRAIGVATVLSLGAALVQPVEAAPFKRSKVYVPDAPVEKQVPNSEAPIKHRDRKETPGTVRSMAGRDTAKLPGTATATVAVPVQAKADRRGLKAGSTPVRLGFTADAVARATKAAEAVEASPAPESARPENEAAQAAPAVELRMLGAPATAKAGIQGVAFALRESGVDTGATEVALDYGTFADAVGGGWATRLQLVSYPACVLTTPAKDECQVRTPLKTSHDYAGETVSAKVNLPTAPSAPTGSGERSGEGSREGRVAAASEMVIAAEAGGGGPNGDFTATSLSPSGSWSMGGATGGFSWSYPIALPPAGTGAGIAPDLALNYSTQAVDGQNNTSNPQASWVGQGWSMEGGYIERTHTTCADDKSLPEAKQSGDSCWAGPIMTLHMPGGSTTAIVKDDDTGEWHTQSENGLRVQAKTGADNGAWNGEYWLVTGRDGVQYTFGRDLLPGLSEADRTDSVLTQPVFSPNTGDPCHNETGQRCTMAYRWNLDLVADRQGNATVYSYTKATNHYESYYNGETIDDKVRRVYDRDGYLKNVRYGLRMNDLGAAAPQQVDFTVAERCFETETFECSDANFTLANATRWPDVPIDQACKAEGACENTSPTFWTRKRLTTITTTYLTSGGARQKVDSYALGQSFFALTDGELLLDSIIRTGWDGTQAQATPAVRFAMTAKANRVEGLHGLPEMPRARMQAIYTETGQDIMLSYADDDGQVGRSKPACTASTIPTSPASNTTECYPVRWTPPGADEILDYFHKPVVTEVGVFDHNGTAPARITTYTYKGAPAWHYDDNEVQKKKARTWAQFRGYGEVEVRAGNPNSASPSGPDQWTLTKTFYYRGMDNDRTTADGTGRRNVVLTDSRGGTHTDVNGYEGQPMETQGYDGSGTTGTSPGALVSTTIHQPKLVATTASRAREGLDALKATNVQPGGSTTHTPYKNSSGVTVYQTTGTGTKYDSHGRALEVTSTATGTTANCVKTDYNDNDDTWVHDLAAEVITYETTCPTETTPDPKIKRAVRTYYDGSNSLGTVTDGLPTRVLTASKLTSGAAPDWASATESTTTYDTYGRAKTSTTEGRTTTTTYTPAGTGATTKVETQLPISTHQTTDDVDPGRGHTTRSVAVDGTVTAGDFDPLGRLTAVWRPGQTKGTDQATETYEYKLSPTAPLAVTTKTLLDRGHGRALAYRTRVVIYDAFGNIRQSQVDADDNGTGNGGRVVTDNFADSHGWGVKAYDHWYTTGAPGTAIITTPQANIDDWSTTTFDGTGRPTAVTSHKAGDTETSPGTGTVKTIYSGNATTVINPAGGISSTTIANGRGGKVEQRNYKTQPTITGNRTDGYTVTGGTYQKLTYSYDAIGQQLTQTTGATNAATTAQATWTNSYDLAGRVTQAVSPDAGTTNTTYWPTGEVKTTTDAADRTVYTAYDDLGRPTDKRATDASGTRLNSWVYDDTTAYGLIGLGKTASSTTYNDGKSYTKTTTGFDAAGRSLGTKVSLDETGLNPSYTSTQTWTSTGLMATRTTSASTSTVGGTGGAAAETVDYYYNTAGNPIIAQGTIQYVAGTVYTPYGEPSRYTFDTNDHTMVQVLTRDAKTRRVTQSVVTSQLAAPQLEKTSYTYDPTGNLTKVVDQQGNASTGPIQTTCYAYDTLRQLSEAWASTDSCATNPAVTGTNAKVGGEQPFWTSWRYDDAGNRTQQIKHGLGTATSTTTTYASGTSDTDTIPEHALASTATTGATTGSTSYAYNADGAMKTQTIGTGTSAKTTTFSYGPDGEVDTIATPTAASEYVRDADGQILVRRDTGATPKTTLFLPDGQEVAVNPTTKAVTTDKYYTFGGRTIAMRTNSSGIRFLIADPNGTNQIAVSTDTWAVTRRYLDPYGNLLANKAGAPAPGTLPGSHGYLNQPENKITGFTELGARFYDPTVGRFTSVDPILTDTDPTAAHGYTYSGNNPIGYSDASGLMLLDSPGGGGGPGHPTPSYKWTPPSHNPNWMYESRGSSSGSGGSSSGGGGSWQSGFISGAGDGAREVIDSFNPVSIAKNIKKLIADPPDVKTFFKSIVTSFTHADDFKAAYDAWKSGDEYAFGKAVGKLVVQLSGDLVGLILGGTKAVTTLTRALKGATAAKPATVFRGDGRKTSDIFVNGMTARNPGMSLEDHLAGGNGLIATSRSKGAAEGFAIQHRGPIYEIDNIGGTTVKYPRKFWYLRAEREVTFTRIEPSQIRGAHMPNRGAWIPNPNYVRP